MTSNTPPELSEAVKRQKDDGVVAWLTEYDGHRDATTDPDTARLWSETLKRPLTPLYAHPPSQEPAAQDDFIPAEEVTTEYERGFAAGVASRQAMADEVLQRTMAAEIENEALRAASGDVQDRSVDILREAQFLVDRLNEYNPEDDDHVREYHGHVIPPLTRLGRQLAALAAAPSSTPSDHAALSGKVETTDGVGKNG